MCLQKNLFILSGELKCPKFGHAQDESLTAHFYLPQKDRKGSVHNFLCKAVSNAEERINK